MLKSSSSSSGGNRRSRWIMAVVVVFLIAAVVLHSLAQSLSMAVQAVMMAPEQEDHDQPVLPSVMITPTPAPTFSRRNVTGSEEIITTIHRKSHANHGVVLFVHVPKSGGTSMWKNIEQLLEGRIDYYLSNRHGGWNQIPALIDQAVRLEDGGKYQTDRVLWTEMHTNMTSFMTVLPQLKEWKRIAKTNNVPFFLFSILRDPVAWAVSCFAHVCLRQKRCKHVEEHLLNEEGLLSVVNPNPQCTFFSKGWHEFDRRLEYVPSQKDCDDVFQAFLDVMDWVGTLEQYDDTLRVLGDILGRDDILAAFEQKHMTANKPQKKKQSLSTNEGEKPKNPGVLHPHELSNQTLEYLEHISWLDRALYNRVQSTYRRDLLFGCCEDESAS